MSDCVEAGDRFVLLDADGERYLLHADGAGSRKERGLGTVDPDSLVGTPYGFDVQVGNHACLVLPARLPDYHATLRRKAQIITPKDAARIAYGLGLGPGMKVLESGIGSGATTTVFASLVGPSGRVVVQELRDDFATFAMGNLARAGLDGHVVCHVGDMTEAVNPDVAAEGPFDALLLDMPEPWLAVRHAWSHLAPGARICCYTPQVSQMEQAHKALEHLGARDVVAMEVIERQWEVKERGARPSFESLGHTAFLVFGQKVQ